MTNIQHVRLCNRDNHYLPGCPPDADAIYYVLKELIEGRVPVLTEENLRYN